MSQKLRKATENYHHLGSKDSVQVLYFEGPILFHILQVFINFATQQQGVSHSSQESPVVHHDHLPV